MSRSTLKAVKGIYKACSPYEELQDQHTNNKRALRGAKLRRKLETGSKGGGKETKSGVQGWGHWVKQVRKGTVQGET